MLTPSVLTPLPLGPLPNDPLGLALVAIVALLVIVLVGRLFLRVAWRILTIAAVVVGIAYLLTVVGLL